MRIDNEVADVLGRCTVTGSVLYLPAEQLDRKLYVKVNKVLTAIRGKWNRKEKGHIFEADPSDVIETILQTGVYTCEKTEFQFFETPPDLVKRLIDLAELRPGDTVIEPSAGNGAIADGLRERGFEPDCIELNPRCREVLKGKEYRIIGEDFLDTPDLDGTCDVIIANPPFTRQQDIDHVYRMVHVASRTVVSVMSASVLFRTDKKNQKFRELFDNMGAVFTELPEKSFSPSGTNVNACIMKLIAD